MEQWYACYDMRGYHLNCGAGCLAILSAPSLFDKRLTLLLWGVMYMLINHN
jgi:hypothetical protein